jgi:hypothetical protein
MTQLLLACFRFRISDFFGSLLRPFDFETNSLSLSQASVDFTLYACASRVTEALSA